MVVPSAFGRTLSGLVLAFCTLGAACAGGVSDQTASTMTPPDSSAQRFQLGVVVHVDEPTVAAFWSQVALGAAEAAESFEVDVDIRGDFNPGVQARIVDTMVVAGIDGLIVSLAAPEALKPALDQAAAAGIPVVTINSGIDYYLDVGALTHVGQDDLAAGNAVGNRLTALQLSGNVLCLVQETRNVALEQRCDGVEETYTGGEVVRLREHLEWIDTARMISLISGKLDERRYAAVVTLGPVEGRAAAAAVKAAQVDAVVTAFDFYPPMAEDLRTGAIAFTVDQRAYLQGYTPVQLLAELLRDGTTPEQDLPVKTGPFFIDATNIDAIEAEREDIDERSRARFPP